MRTVVHPVILLCHRHRYHLHLHTAVTRHALSGPLVRAIMDIKLCGCRKCTLRLHDAIRACAGNRQFLPVSIELYSKCSGAARTPAIHFRSRNLRETATAENPPNERCPSINHSGRENRLASASVLCFAVCVWSSSDRNYREDLVLFWDAVFTQYRPAEKKGGAGGLLIKDNCVLIRNTPSTASTADAPHKPHRTEQSKHSLKWNNNSKTPSSA